MPEETYETFTCEKCGGEFPSLDATSVWSGDRAQIRELFCVSCADEHTNECRYCGNRYRNEHLRETIDDDYVCASCSREHNMIRCENCGKWLLRGESTSVYGDRYCDSCCESRGGTTSCTCCGSSMFSNDAHYREYDESDYCGRCRSNYSSYEWENGPRDSDDDDDDSDRGEYVSEDRDHVRQEPERNYIRARGDDCFEVVHSRGMVYGYGYKPNPIFYPYFNDALLYMGVELECEFEHVYYSDQNRMLVRLAEQYPPFDQFLYFKTDGSLNHGFEVVSHPGTLGYHMQEFDWKFVLKEFIKRGGTSHDTDTCGLHVHVPKAWFTDTERIKLGVFVNKNRPNMEILGRREHNDYAQYKNIVKGELRVAAYSPERYEALNFENDATIEFRLFRGTLRYSTFIATLSLVDAACRYVKVQSINNVAGDDAGWNGFMSFIHSHRYGYRQLIDYLAGKSLWPYKERREAVNDEREVAVG